MIFFGSPFRQLDVLQMLTPSGTLRVNVNGRFQRLAFSNLPGKKAMGRALLAILQRIKDDKKLKATIELLA